MTDTDLSRALRLLGLGPADLKVLRQDRSDTAQQATDDLKQRVRKAFRRVAASLHPDRTGGDTAKTEDFKLVSAFVDAVERMAPPRRVLRPTATYRVKVTVSVPARYRVQ